MQADHGVRSRCGGCYFVDVEAGRISGENSIWFADAIELAEDFFLQCHAFEYRFNNQVRTGEFTIVQRWIDELETLVNELLCEAAALYGVGVIFLNAGKAAIKRGLIRLFQQHRNPGVRENHGDATAHGTRPDNANGLDV